MTRSTLSILLASAVLLCSGHALALELYQKRVGIFYGFGFGGAQIMSDAEGAESHIGYNYRARVGGGINETITLDLELGFNQASYTQSSIEVNDLTRTIGVGASYFLSKGPYLRVQGGIADIKSEIGETSNTETGLFIAGGAGYEFFANARLAIGVGVDFQHQIYDESNVNALSFGVTANWY